MRPALEQWMTARVQIFDPDRENATDYDPTADTGDKSTPLLVLDSGANGAIVQPIRSPTRILEGQQPTAILGVRFQIKRAPVVSVPIRAGMTLKVLDGGNDAALVGPLFSLVEGVDSSLAWDRIYDAVLVTGGI
jgi:hypothetical protein